VNSIESGIPGDQARKAQASTATVLDAPLSERLAQDVLRDSE
jgi:hypothetical protein